jgi:hypothetical protein
VQAEVSPWPAQQSVQSEQALVPELVLYVPEAQLSQMRS